MPGIVGIISKKPREECSRRVQAMVASMCHEPVYVSGTCADPDLGIYAGWIAHKNSFASGQICWNENRDVALIFSGECFLDPQTGTQLRQQGHQIGTEQAGWLIHLYEEEGDRFFERLNGLFSGLLIDKRREKAFLFNDRYGVGRIYWHENADGFYFASEAKALLWILPELRAFDEQGVGQYLAYGCTMGGRTLFRSVGILPGASLWTFANGKCRKETYFSPETWEKLPSLSGEDFQTRFQETFKRILPRYFESESRMGIALTGGLDSRMIMACLPEAGVKPVCYTFSGQFQDTLDARLSSKIATACGLEHQILRIETDFFANFAGFADRTICITDGCLGVLGAHEVYMNARACRLAPTRVTGNYGSEVLRGVSTFKPLELAPRLISPDLYIQTKSIVQHFSAGKKHPISFAAFQEIPWKRFGVLAAGNSQVTFRTPYLDNEIVALAYQAPEVLWRSAIPALRLIQANHPALARIPTDMGAMGEHRGWAATSSRLFSKTTFKLDYLYNEGLPHWLSPLDPVFKFLSSRTGILGLHKFLHYRNWFRAELAGYVSGILTDAQTRRCAFWDSGFLESMARDHTRGRKNYVNEINSVLTLEAVERQFFRNISQPVDARTAPKVECIQFT